MFAGKIILNLGDFTSHTFADAQSHSGGPNAKAAAAWPSAPALIVLTISATRPRVTMKVAGHESDDDGRSVAALRCTWQLTAPS